jgi:hypothetical protein
MNRLFVYPYSMMVWPLVIAKTIPANIFSTETGY